RGRGVVVLAARPVVVDAGRVRSGGVDVGRGRFGHGAVIKPAASPVPQHPPPGGTAARHAGRPARRTRRARSPVVVRVARPDPGGRRRNVSHTAGDGRGRSLSTLSVRVTASAMAARAAASGPRGSTRSGPSARAARTARL